MTKQQTEQELVALPQPYGKAPLFAPNIQCGERIVNVEKGTWKIGAGTLFDEEIAKKYSRGFDIRHAQVIFALLKYYHENGKSYNDPINLSWRELLRISGFSFGKSTLKQMKELLADLRYTTTTMAEEGKTYLFNVLGDASIQRDENNKEILEYLVFSNRFIQMVSKYNNYFSFQLSYWNKMPSSIAQAIYIYLPSRALNSTCLANAAKISLTNLFMQLGMPVPLHKSKRKEILTQNQKSILSQLDGAPIHKEKILRVKLELTKDRSDYNLCAWVETRTGEIDYNDFSNSQLAIWWQESGGSLIDYQDRMRKKPELDPYETEKLRNSGINTMKDKLFLRMVKALLPYGILAEIAGEMNMLAQEGKLEKPYPFFIAKIKKEMKQTFKQPSLQI